MLGRSPRGRVTEVNGETTAPLRGDGTTLEPSPGDAVGAVLGNYRLGPLLGEGGMGRVYRAEHVLLGREVALKLLRPEQAARRSAIARFFQEARVVNRIRHRNIVDVPDLVELPDGTVFIVMELLRGRSLRDVLAAGPLDPGTTITIAAQITAALAATHAVGVLHRDLKPANVHVADDRSGDAWVKLLDFGIAKLIGDDDGGSGPRPAHVTQEGQFVGTPAYMSPEQVTAGPVDVRSDLYALGVMLFEMVTGRRPFTGATVADYVRAHCSAPVPSLDVPVPAPLAALIRRLLAKAPADRPGNAAEVLAALAAARVSPPPASRRRWRWPVIALGAVAALGGVAAAVVSTGDRAPVAPVVPAVAPVVTSPSPRVASPPPTPAPVTVASPAPVAAPAPAPAPARPAPPPRKARPRPRDPAGPAAPTDLMDAAFTVNPYRQP